MYSLPDLSPVLPRTRLRVTPEIWYIVIWLQLGFKIIQQQFMSLITPYHTISHAKRAHLYERPIVVMVLYIPYGL